MEIRKSGQTRYLHTGSGLVRLGVVVFTQAAFEPPDLPVDLVAQAIDGCVHIAGGFSGEQRPSAGVYAGFGQLLKFFNFDDNADGNNLVKVPGKALHFFCDVCAKRWSDFYVMTSNVQLHYLSPFTNANPELLSFNSN
jgi:hypothetical protein